MTGWVKLWRKLEDSNVWGLSPLAVKIWIWVLMNANHSDSEWMGEKLCAGELITSYANIARGVAYTENRSLIVPSQKAVRTALTRLSVLDALRHGPRQNSLWIKVLQWELYQGSENDDQGRDLIRTGAGTWTNQGTQQEEKNSSTSSIQQKYSSLVGEIFAYWQAQLGSPRFALTPPRQKKIAQRLKEGMTLDEAKEIIDACAESDFHVNGKFVLPEKHLFNSREKVEWWLSKSDAARSPLDKLFGDTK